MTPYRTDFVSFVEKCFHTLRNNEAIQGTYIPYLAGRLKRLCDGKPARLILNLPPRHLKTIIGGVCVAAWEMAKRPSNTVLVISGSDLLGGQTLGNLQTIMRAPWYRKAFGVNVVASNEGGLKTAQGGGVKFFSIGGHFTGMGGDLIVVDDPVDIKDAHNLPRLLQVNGWFDNKVESRLNNPAKGRVIVIAHRLSEDDLSGHLLRSDSDWEHVKLALVAPEAEHFSAMGVEFRREKGELLRPNCYSEKQLQKLQRQTNFPTLYQQNPGGRTWAKLDPACIGTHVGGVPNTLPLVISVDPARSTSSGSSYSVIQAWVQLWGEHILIQQFRDRVSFEDLRDILFSICRTHQPSIILIEDNSNAAGLAHRLRSSDFNVELVPIGGKTKLERLEPHISLIRNGGIKVDNTSVDREAFIAELIEFPSVEFDDQVDALTQYLDYVTTHDVPPRRKRAICAIRKSRGPFYC